MSPFLYTTFYFKLLKTMLIYDIIIGKITKKETKHWKALTNRLLKE